MASMAAFVYFWSSAYDVSGCCTTDTLYPSFLRIVATGSQPEPSAKAPCTRTTFLICCAMTILLCGKDPLGSLTSMSNALPLLSCAIGADLWAQRARHSGPRTPYRSKRAQNCTNLPVL